MLILLISLFDLITEKEACMQVPFKPKEKKRKEKKKKKFGTGFSPFQGRAFLHFIQLLVFQMLP